MENCGNRNNCIINDKENIYYKANKIIISEEDKNIIWNLDKILNINNTTYLQLCQENQDCEYIGEEIPIENAEKIEKAKMDKKIIYLENENKGIIIFKNPLFNKSYSILNNLNQKLIDTMNTNILENMDFFNKLKIYSEVLDNKHKNTITKLIYNHYIHNKPVYNKIGGPSVLIHLYNKEYLKEIYIFGEEHSENIDCTDEYIPIENYLENLIQNTDVFIDLFIEIPDIKKSCKKTDGLENYRLRKILYTLKKCIELESRSECYLSRIHYIDIRDNEENKITPLVDLMMGIFRIYNIENNSSLISKYFIENKDLIQEVINKLHNENPEEILLYILDDLSKCEKINKESIKILFDKNILIDFIKNKILDKIIETKRYKKSKINKLYKNLSDTIENDDLLILACILNVILEIYVDIYTIYRIFKKFESDKLKQPTEAHNIILYAGLLHSSNVAEFLIEKLNFEIIESENSTNLYNNCIDMTNIKQPLFNEFLF